MRTTIITIFALLALVFVTQCGGEDDGYTIADGTLTGEINGAEWTFVQGDTDSFLSDDEGFFASLYPEAYTSCDVAGPSGVDSVLVILPKEPGEYPLSLQRSVTFVVAPSDNYIATTGLLVIDEVTADTIVGGLYATYEDDFIVDGHFTVDICD